MSGARLFTVRVWRQAEQFRAVVRAVGEEDAHLFTARAPLADYLVEAADAGCTSEEAGPLDTLEPRKPGEPRFSP